MSIIKIRQPRRSADQALANLKAARDRRFLLGKDRR